MAVIDVCNNRYRMIAAIHHDRRRVFVLRLMTHRPYDTNEWKAEP